MDEVNGITTVLVAVYVPHFQHLKVEVLVLKSLMLQTQASDQWSFYEAKSIKSYIFEIATIILNYRKAGSVAF